MFETAVQLRADIRAFLESDPAERRRNLALMSPGLLNGALKRCFRWSRKRSMASRRLCVAGLRATMRWRACRWSWPSFTMGATQGTLDRLKMCAAEECRRVFYDRSKPATRRWCMSTLCGNRIKTRTYRARHRGEG